MKRPYAIALMIVAMTFISSCNSFNHYVLPNTPTPTIIAPAPAPTHNVAVESSLSKQCEMYILPAFTGTPDLPFDEILAADKDNPKSLDKINSKHISELRDYIARFKSDIRASHNEYLRRCYRDHGIRYPGEK